MERASRTLVTDFVFVRFSNSPRVQLLFFSLFLLIHLSSLVGSALIVHTAAVDGRLHTPMYLFICNLSLVELWYTTVTVPKMPANSLNSQGVISGLSHISQYYFFSLATAELFILTTMAFDVALPSANHSSTHCCSALRLGVLWLGLLAYTYAIQTVGYAFSTVTILEALVFTMASYAPVLTTIPAMASAAARRKAFYTCAAHLSVVTINFSTLTSKQQINWLYEELFPLESQICLETQVLGDLKETPNRRVPSSRGIHYVEKGENMQDIKYHLPFSLVISLNRKTSFRQYLLGNAKEPLRREEPRTFKLQRDSRV
ncbi:olfactory receptor 6F1 [Camelus ferus]|uniref:Olfactory receptor 6F1 n=1 Tax=Camelus ferus TaxID=419612 RepID=A0A8B7KIP3_CAMFR|nr:olfactory receptor 6F1-like [Camelus dromedarius]XP_014423799.2 olfactory receptor 6F1 [Camelus ferus]